MVPSSGFYLRMIRALRGASRRSSSAEPKGLVLRYDTTTGADGLPAGEGAFLFCSYRRCREGRGAPGRRALPPPSRAERASCAISRS
jgi:hypothetical protein